MSDINHEIDPSKFHLQKNFLPTRGNSEYEKFQQKNQRSLYEPIPIKYDRPERKFDPDNPVWYSIREFVEYARAIPGWPPNLDRTDRTRGKEWDWGYNLAECYALYDKGWSDGFSAIRHGMEEAARAAMMTVMKDNAPIRDMHGAFVDVDAFLRGEPENMFEFQETPQPIMHLEVEIDSFVVCTTDASEVLYRGAAIMAGIMALRRLGVFVTAYQREVATTMTARKDGNSPVTATIHMLGEGLTENLSEVLLALAHPGFHRKVYFMAVNSAWGCNFSGLSYSRRDSKDFYTKPGSGKIVIPGNFKYNDDSGIDWGNSWSSPKAAEGLVHMMLKAAGK